MVIVGLYADGLASVLGKQACGELEVIGGWNAPMAAACKAAAKVLLLWCLCGLSVWTVCVF
jgi:hypothetical protein